MLEGILVVSVLAAVYWAYSAGRKHGKASVEADQLKAMAESVKRGIDARRSVRSGNDPDGVQERSFRD